MPTTIITMETPAAVAGGTPKAQRLWERFVLLCNLGREMPADHDDREALSAAVLALDTAIELECRQTATRSQRVKLIDDLSFHWATSFDEWPAPLTPSR